VVPGVKVAELWRIYSGVERVWARVIAGRSGRERGVVVGIGARVEAIDLDAGVPHRVA
jgi:hypothetical protein